MFQSFVANSIRLYWLCVTCLLLSFSSAFVTNPVVRSISKPRSDHLFHETYLPSSFYSDFEQFDNNDDEDDDDDEDDEDLEDELDDAAVADFRSRMGNLFGEGAESDDDSESSDASKDSISSVDELISFATSKGSSTEEEVSTEWANPTDDIEAGVVLLANPAKFCVDIGDPSASPSPALLAKFGLTLPPPSDLGPDRRADLLPVLTLLERHPLKGSQAVLLNRRTGYLLGDLEQPPSPEEEGGGGAPSFAPPKLGAFMIQPLWFGGTSAGSGESSGDMGSTAGLDMIHLCPYVKDTKQLTEDGLFWGGDPGQAQEAMTDPRLDRVMTGFDFKFFVQSTRWFPLQLEKEIRDGTWFVASVSKEVLFKSRDRMGTRRAKPLWTDIMELMGGEYKDIRDELYGDE
mmetsp:Transcript_6482/g.9282  ORF Transcript_6482/g.9282 Transcript_6482/m.9282 type:complete len:403 (+) Transcript_6482:142-1350(+)